MDEQLRELENRMNARFDRMEKLVADLIGIVGKTNGMVSDIQKDLGTLHSDIKRMDGQNALVEKRLDWQRGKIGQLEEAVATK